MPSGSIFGHKNYLLPRYGSLWDSTYISGLQILETLHIMNLLWMVQGFAPSEKTWSSMGSWNRNRNEKKPAWAWALFTRVRRGELTTVPLPLTPTPAQEGDLRSHHLLPEGQAQNPKRHCGSFVAEEQVMPNNAGHLSGLQVLARGFHLVRFSG